MRAATTPDTSHSDHLLRRLEAFSDLVIAFSLSELAFNLQVPQRPHELLEHPIHLVGFVASFVIICNVWWLHHRLFAYYFVPDRLSVILNFVLLGFIALLSYALQLFFHFGQEIIVTSGYAITLGCVFGLMAALYFKGLTSKELELSDELRHAAAMRVRRLSVVSATFLCSLFLIPFGAAAVAGCWFVIFPLLAISKIIERSRRLATPDDGRS